MGMGRLVLLGRSRSVCQSRRSPGRSNRILFGRSPASDVSTDSIEHIPNNLAQDHSSFIFLLDTSQNETRLETSHPF